MAAKSIPPTSFSTRRRWVILFSVLASIAAVVALVTMVNYLGGRHFMRFNWSTQTRIQPSAQTIHLLKSLTNEVKVVIYYNKKDPVYSFVSELLNEYQLVNRKITVETVDYVHDPGAAQKIKTRYARYGFGSVEDKDLVIFESNGVKMIPGSALGEYSLETAPDEKELKFQNKLKGFKGDSIFSSTLLNVTRPKPLQAYFLMKHGEHIPGGKENAGYLSFTTLLLQNYIMPKPLDLVGTNAIPGDCNLLIIAGPTQPLLPSEVEKVRQYLTQGGRMFVLFNSDSLSINTGLEALLGEWGVEVGRNVVRDPNNTTLDDGSDLIVTRFNDKHPLVNSLLSFRLRMMLPRSIGKLENAKPHVEAPKVDILAATGDKAFINNNVMPAGKQVPLMVAVEKAAPKGVYADAERGTTRIVVTGDSRFLDNQLIVVDKNQDFAINAINWLLDRTQLLKGAGSHPIQEYRFLVTKAQMNSVEWLLLGGMPGGILLVGGLVWLRRRR
jgi:ABC-type uncharacterized transport system